ncbi:unnamed protein product [Paramecium pentaurelia]|uniref:Uncharacterized protein n=1 Tax=Paramecium pentaurelia TaxID=43138 RepID=A0A8S1Y1T5_9CILI|nr:unnamed protein product [Paramecium pentaurelia]
MKLSFSECSLLSSVKSGDLGLITHLIEELAKSVSTFLQIQIKSDNNFRQQLYTFTFQFIIQALQGQNIDPQIDSNPPQQQNIIIEIIKAIKEFKIELFDLAAQNPNMSFFDFLVTQQFNDLYDILTASEKQLNGQLEPLTPKKLKQEMPSKHNHELYFQTDTIKKRSMSASHSTTSKLLQQNNIELDFALLQQFVYNQIEHKQDSPKAKNKQNPQLFSFDSTFVRDLPLSKYNAISNFDEQFNFTLQKSQEDAIQTSRFESQRIDEEEYFGTDQSSSDINLTLDRSYRDWDVRFRQLAEKEKQVAQRELKTIIQEKHLLNRTRSQRMISPNSKEQDHDLINRTNNESKQCLDAKSTLKFKQKLKKTSINERSDVFII